ncbi:MAG: septation regulator SpoVG [Deltaproteobacteria bacterium]|nr:septation regulator SpoVG [Deltaproteobacteria bacterium]MCL4872715.1 septation regulator SpoVG [bacterium]
MRITEIKVLPVDGDEKLKAYVTIKLDDCFVVRDMKVIKGNTGYFVAMPAKKMKDGTYRDLVHPLDKPTRQMLEDQVMSEFKKVIAEEDGAQAFSNAV